MTLTNRLGSDHRSAVGADHFCIVSENPTEVRRIEVLLIERAKVAVHHLLNLDDMFPVHRNHLHSGDPRAVLTWS